MHTRSMTRPFQILLAVIALLLAGTVGAAIASGAASPAQQLTGAPAAAVPAVTDISSDGTVDQLIAAALSEPALGGDPTVGAAPSTRPLAGAARGAGILRTIIGRTDRAQIDVSTTTGEQTLLYVRGKIASVSGHGHHDHPARRDEPGLRPRQHDPHPRPGQADRRFGPVDR